MLLFIVIYAKLCVCACVPIHSLQLRNIYISCCCSHLRRLEVRCATLDTITVIAAQSPVFALSCQDLLVDMLTDDIQDVRLAAVRALGVVGDQVSQWKR